MIVAQTSTTPSTISTPKSTPASHDGEKKPPSEASLELAYQYFEIKSEYESLENIESQAIANRASLDHLRSDIKHEYDDIHQLSKAIEKLQTQIEK
jgi:hypothetical protein